MSSENEDNIDELLNRLETTLRDVKEEVEAQNDTGDGSESGGGFVSMAMKLLNFHQNYTIPATLSTLESAISSLRTYRKQSGGTMDSTTGQIAAAELLGLLDNVQEALDQGEADISEDLRDRFDEIKAELESRFEDATDVQEDKSPQERTLEMMKDTIENAEDGGESTEPDESTGDDTEAQIEVTQPGEKSEVSTNTDSEDGGDTETTKGPSVEDELEQIKRQVGADEDDDNEES